MTWPPSTLSLAVVLLVTAAMRADEAQNERRAARLLEMRERAAQLKPKSVEDKPRPLKLRGEPLMRFDDPTRDFYDGTLWAWGEPGRPRLLVSMEKYEKLWAYEFIATSDHLSLAVPSGKTWQPKSPAVEMKNMEGRPAPAASAVGRRQQARELSRRFEMAEFLPPDEARTVLRLFPRPIHEYGDEKGEVLTGAMFVFANGTNPEILLIVEAVRLAEGGTVWTHGCAPFSTARLEARLAGRVVWEAEKMSKPDFDRPYIAVTTPLSGDEPLPLPISLPPGP